MKLIVITLLLTAAKSVGLWEVCDPNGTDATACSADTKCARPTIGPKMTAEGK